MNKNENKIKVKDSNGNIIYCDDCFEKIEKIAEEALMKCCHYGLLKEVKEFIKQGINVDVKNSNGLTPLLTASYYGHLDVVKELIKAGADVNAKTKSGDTALLYASEKRHLNVVKELIKAGARE